MKKEQRGKAYNNLIVNSRYGMRITTDADVPNAVYDNQYYYGTASVLVAQFYPSTGVAVTKPGDIKSITAGTVNPQFANYNVDGFNYATATIPIGFAAMPALLTHVGSSDFRLLPSSPAINKGKTDFTPLGVVNNKSGTYGATISLPGKDIGAYQADNSGNGHF